MDYQDPEKLKLYLLQENEYYHELLNCKGYLLSNNSNGVFLFNLNGSSLYNVIVGPMHFFSTKEIIKAALSVEKENN